METLTSILHQMRKHDKANFSNIAEVRGSCRRVESQRSITSFNSLPRHCCYWTRSVSSVADANSFLKRWRLAPQICAAAFIYQTSSAIPARRSPRRPARPRAAPRGPASPPARPRPQLDSELPPAAHVSFISFPFAFNCSFCFSVEPSPTSAALPTDWSDRACMPAPPAPSPHRPHRGDELLIKP